MSDVYLYAGISGDFNPLHVNEENAWKTIFGRRIAHGSLSIAFLSTVLGTKLPGFETLARQISVEYISPICISDAITAEVEVIEKIVKRNIVKLRVACKNQDGKEVLQSLGVMMPPLEKFRNF